MTGEPIRRRVIVHGRVHDVWFRATTEEHAVLAGLAGWVRNCADGTVEAVFEGPCEAVEKLIRFCHEGPRMARVERVETFEEIPEGLAGFRTRA